MDDVARLYGLASRVSALEALRVTFRDYVRNYGLRLVKEDGEVGAGRASALRLCTHA